MSNRAATILAVAAVISLVCIYGSFAQVPELDRGVTQGAITVGPPPIRLQQELPGRYQLSTVIDRANAIELVVIDTHTGQCWSRTERRESWRDWGSPVKKE